jgi:hypothetical protein
LVGPPIEPSEHIQLARPSCGPHFDASQVGALGSAAVATGGRRQIDLSQVSSAAQFELSVQAPRAGSQRHGPPQTSVLSQTICSPALQLGVVQPQLRGGEATPVAGSVTAVHGHW